MGAIQPAMTSLLHHVGAEGFFFDNAAYPGSAGRKEMEIMARNVKIGLFVLVVSGLFTALGLAFAADGDEETGTIEGSVDNATVRNSPAVVYIKDAKGDFKPPEENPVMDQAKLTFTPRVLPVLVGTTVRCPNNDTVQHNIFSPTKSVKTFNLGLYPPGESKDVKFDKVGVVPLLCNVHAEMAAFIVVLPNPYFARTDKEGNFKIEHVPVGNYKLSFWNEKLRPETVDVPVKAGKSTKVKFSDLKKGPYSIELLK
jgi:plastocyanin